MRVSVQARAHSMGTETASGAAEASREHPVHVWGDVQKGGCGESALLSPQLAPCFAWEMAGDGLG